MKHLIAVALLVMAPPALADPVHGMWLNASGRWRL